LFASTKICYLFYVHVVLILVIVNPIRQTCLIHFSGCKVCTENGWFAARPSGTGDVYKIYAESFKGEDHLRQIQAEVREIVNTALA